MSRTISKWLFIGAPVIAVLAGAGLGLGAETLQAADRSFFGDYTCLSPGACTSGSYTCTITCEEAVEGCSCTIS